MTDESVLLARQSVFKGQKDISYGILQYVGLTSIWCEIGSCGSLRKLPFNPTFPVDCSPSSSLSGLYVLDFLCISKQSPNLGTVFVCVDGLTWLHLDTEFTRDYKHAHSYTV